MRALGGSARAATAARGDADSDIEVGVRDQRCAVSSAGGPYVVWWEGGALLPLEIVPANSSRAAFEAAFEAAVARPRPVLAPDVPLVTRVTLRDGARDAVLALDYPRPVKRGEAEAALEWAAADTRDLEGQVEDVNRRARARVVAERLLAP